MKSLFNYCYYRISKFYENWGEKNGHIGGSIVLFGCIGFNCLSLLSFLFSLFNKKNYSYANRCNFGTFYNY